MKKDNQIKIFLKFLIKLFGLFQFDSENMLFERIKASGVGITIGSIGTNTVNNITFRDCFMHNTWKGIYMKFGGVG